MDEQRQPDFDPARRAEERADMEAQGLKGRVPADTDEGPDVEGHLLAGAEGARGTRGTRGTRDVA